MIDEKKVIKELNDQIMYLDSKERYCASQADYSYAGLYAERKRGIETALAIVMYEAKAQRKKPTMASKGGHARAASLPKARRVAIARKAARKRWKTHKPTESYER